MCERRTIMPTTIIAAVVLTAGLITAALIGRYDIASHGGELGLVYRVDRLTGTVESCQIGLSFAEKHSGNKLPENSSQPSWCRPSFASSDL